MKDLIEEKMKSLMKYVPFIDFVLKIDRQKYIKFINIKKWIMLRKKKYPLSDLNKIEQSIITQYKNLLVENNVQIPQNITNIFAPMNLKQFVNLCSDDEDDEIQNKMDNKDLNIKKTSKEEVEEKSTNSSTNKNLAEPEIVYDSEDDLEIVSIDYVDKTGMKKKEEHDAASKNDIAVVSAKEEVEDIDDISKELLSKIDKLAEDDIKMKSSIPEPNNYTFRENECSDLAAAECDKKEIVFEKCDSESDVLFKRRIDFKDEEVVVTALENSGNKKKGKLKANKSPIEIISLDSGSESEACNDDVQHSTSSLVEFEIVLEDASSNSNDSSNKNKKDQRVELLCNSIDSVLPDMNELLIEIEDVRDDTTTSDTSGNKTNPEEGGSDKENSNQPLSKNNTNNTSNTIKLNPQQVSKILEDISSKTEFELETLYEALEYVRQLNSSSPKNVTENNSNLVTPPKTPPPAPPPINQNVLSSQSSYPPQQQTQPQPQQTNLASPSATVFNQNSNFVGPFRRKININDPRIKKELQAIQNSPLFKFNVLDANIEESIRKICQAQQQPHQPQQPTNTQTSYVNTTKINMGPNSKNSTTTFHKSSISYGEYKRRQLEKKLEMEKQREEERNAKSKAQMEREKIDFMNSEEGIRSILLNTLNPCKDQLTTLWNQQKSPTGNSLKNTNNNSNSSQNATTTSKKNNIVDLTKGQEQKKKKQQPTKAAKQTKNNNQRPSTQNQKINADQKLNRVYKELNCTVKGFNQIQDYIPDMGEKSPENCLQSDTNSAQTTKAALTPKSIGLRRRSSMHALSAISEQLGQQSDCSDSELNEKQISKRRQTYSSNNPSAENLQSLPKRRKTIDELIKPTKRTKVLRITDDDTTSVESFFSDKEENRRQIAKEICFTKEPVIKLRRLTSETIRQHQQRLKENTALQNPMDDQSVKLKKTSEIVQNPKEPGQKIPKLKKYNNDCQMTERSINFCVLCRSKPADLTNHYIGRHKTESYVARLDWAELEELTINTPFVKLQSKTKNQRFDRYEVECPFCKEKIVDQFINLYNHYSIHTGEYAFQCSHCHLSKPYRPDIQSHIFHSKTCRNSSIQVMYRYPPQAQCIYLHYCTICNFAQLNEANVLKHLREHHPLSKATESNIQKCILAAMSDGPETNETNKSTSPTTTTPLPLSTSTSTPQEVNVKTTAEEINPPPTTIEMKFKVDDDDIPVSNEPCLEDDMEEEKYSLEEQLKQLHEGPAITTNKPMIAPMTVIHSPGNSLKVSPDATAIQPNFNSNAAKRHIPMIIKTETAAADVENKHVISSPQINQPVAAASYSVYEKYRSYPQNVNYLGLYKCMIGDCYYSTDCSEEIYKHLTEHSSDELKPFELLQCPYCVISMDTPMTALKLVEHMRSQHGHLNYQCSMCCYRSCNASNVHIHQKMHHSNSLDSCKIYKCFDDVLQHYDKQKLFVNKQIAKNIFNFSCKICYADFYHTQLLINHLEKLHQVHDAFDLKIYSCIYCPLTTGDKNEIRIHLATKHPCELPLIYDHNKPTINIDEDFKTDLDVINLSESVECVEIKPNVCDGPKENVAQDVKPDVEQLVLMNEETAKVRLRKLTARTGVPPDNLYRCPESTCGGFFTIFEMWLRHMKVRHHTLECQCPHCPPSAMLLPLEQFELHFEQHRGHTYICFHCSTTSPTEILACQHGAQIHKDLIAMRFETIPYNLTYSYNIMIQSDLLEEREAFITELLAVLGNRLKDLENNEIKNIKQQWPVQDNTPWVDDYLQILSNRKVARRCLVKYCNFRTLKEENLYRHLSTSHIINGTQFNCSKCDYHLEKCSNFDEIFNHIKLHNEYIFICAACSLISSSRSKMTSHIEEQHSARDVPVIHLFRTDQQMYVKVFIVFAVNCLTFSTMKNCFCCSEQNMSGDVFSLHLKRYHKLFLNYYCEKCTLFSFKSLKEVRSHFQEVHNSDSFKIRCELAAHVDLNVKSLNDLQIQILTSDPVPQQTPSSLHIKSEPLDVSDRDNVIALEDDDIVIQNSLKEKHLKPAQEIPKLKCASLSKLMEQPSAPTSLSTIQSDLHHHLASSSLSTIQTDLHHHLPSSSLLLPAISSYAAQTPYGGYNLAPVMANTNISSNTFHSLAASSASTNYYPHLAYNNAVLPVEYSGGNNIPTMPSYAQNSFNINQTSHVQMPVLSINSATSSHFLRPQNNDFFMPTQNAKNNS